MADKETRTSRMRAGGEAVRRRLKERPHIRPAVYGYLTEEKESLRQGFAALFLSSTGELVAGIALAGVARLMRSGEGRVGEEGRFRWVPSYLKKKTSRRV